MGSKHKVDGICKMLYFIYIIFLIYPIKCLINIGVLSKNIEFFNIIDSIQIGYGAYYFIFQLIFLYFLLLGIKNSLKDIEIFEDKDKFDKIQKKLVPYKGLIILTIILSISIIFITRKKELIIPSIFLISISILIHFAKDVYFKSYLFDRKLVWIEKVNDERYDDSDIDSKKWRYKIWYNKKEKVEFKYRNFDIVSNILHIIIFSSIFIFIDFILLRLINLYFLIFHLFALIENVFNIFTSIDGICTGIYEQSTRTRRYYNVVVTDYKNKREIKVKIDTGYYIKEGDYLTVVHGVFSKQLVSINSIKLNRKDIGSIFAPLILICLFVFPNMGERAYIMMNKINPRQTNKVTLDYEDKQKIENPKEALPLDVDYYDKVININKEQTFNDVNIELDKLYLGKNNSKVCFYITNNTNRGMVINVDYFTHIKCEEGKNSNILLPGKRYSVEMDIFEKYNKKEDKQLLLNLEYTLSETILNEYLDFNYYSYYPLNVIDNDCMIYINLNDGKVDMNFNEYKEFYTKSNEVIKFLKTSNT